LEQGYEEGERELLKKIKYVDDEGDWITVAAEEAWEEAVRESNGKYWQGK